MRVQSPRRSKRSGASDLDRLKQGLKCLLGEVSRYRSNLSEIAGHAQSRRSHARHDVFNPKARQDLFKAASRACDDYAAMLRKMA
jgi:hypothetical protein